jgi:hypothetical protein
LPFVLEQGWPQLAVCREARVGALLVGELGSVSCSMSASRRPSSGTGDTAKPPRLIFQPLASLMSSGMSTPFSARTMALSSVTLGLLAPELLPSPLNAIGGLDLWRALGFCAAIEAGSRVVRGGEQYTSLKWTWRQTNGPVRHSLRRGESRRHAAVDACEGWVSLPGEPKRAINIVDARHCRCQAGPPC